MWQKNSTNSFYPNNKRVYCVIIAEGKVNRHENSAEYVGAVVRRCCTMQMFLKISQNSQENLMYASLFLNKHLAWRRQSCNLIKREILPQVVFCEVCEILKITTTSGRLLLDNCFCIYQNINYHKVSVSELIISKSFTGGSTWKEE